MPHAFDPKEYNRIVKLEMKHDALRYLQGALEVLAEDVRREGLTMEKPIEHVTRILAAEELEKIRRTVLKRWRKTKDALKNVA